MNFSWAFLLNKNYYFRSEMNKTELELWTKIKHFEFDDPSDSLTFSARLARENGWELTFALQVILEYKKFMFLLCIAKGSLTPSDEVDQVWHLHLIYTKLYWNDWCVQTLGKQIHHGPTKGGESEKLKFDNLYESTKSFYLEIFGIKPPENIWPDSKVRFKNNKFVRVNTNFNWVIKKPFRL